MHQNRFAPIAGIGYTEGFFDINLSDQELMLQPHIETSSTNIGEFALRIGDNGLNGLGLNEGDYILFSPFIEKNYRDEILLVRSEGKYIIRISDHITPLDSVLSTPGDYFPSIILPSENIRILCCSSGVIKQRDDLNIISMDSVEF